MLETWFPSLVAVGHGLTIHQLGELWIFRTFTAVA